MATKFMSLDGEEKEVKKTVFTHIIDDRKELADAFLEPDNFANVLHIGYDNTYGDVFKCWSDDINYFALFFGTKGDEFK